SSLHSVTRCRKRRSATGSRCGAMSACASMKSRCTRDKGRKRLNAAWRKNIARILSGKNNYARPDVIKLPPLHALRVFEAVARLGNFTNAAHELHLTQSAVSHQIRNLEEFF